jgi:hypothetical protein
MTPERRMDDERIARLLGSVSAEPNPAVMARVRARIAAGAGAERWEIAMPAGLAWLFRPLALSGAAAACVCALAAGLWFGGSTNGVTNGTSLLATSSETLPGALLDELAAPDAGSNGDVVRDSGGPS